jgi:general secretion pathway protein H
MQTNKRFQNDGFSLIELMIVVGILGLVALIAIPSITSTFRLSVQSAGREISALIKETSNSAQITGKVHRVVYDLKNETYWAESSGENPLLKSDESVAMDKDRPKSYKTSEEEEEEKKANGGFHQENSLTKKKRNLPVGVSFKDVITEQSDQPITEGLAYTHIFPQGLTEKTLIHLQDKGENVISVVVSNLLGRTTVEGRDVAQKDVFGKPGAR